MNPRLHRFLFPFAKREPLPQSRYANYHARVFSSTIDVTCLFFLLFEPFAWLTQALYGENGPGSALREGADMTWQQVVDTYLGAGSIGLMLVNTIVQLLIMGALMISCQYGFGTTPGRYIVGLKLADAKTGKDPTLWQLIRRFLGYFVSLPPLMLGYIWCSWDKKRQTWHDKIGGTVVLDMRPQGWYWAQVKRGWNKLRGKAEITPVPANDDTLPPPEDTVREPAEGKRDGDGQ